MMLQAALEGAGAVFGLDGESPIHFGDPLREQLFFEQGQGVHYAGPIGVVAVSGPDRLSWLTTLGTQIVTGLKPGESKETLLLDANGRIEFAAGVIDDGDTAFLFTEADRGSALAQFLDSMRFMLRVEVADRSAEYAGFLTVNSAAEVPGEFLLWNDPWPGPAQGGARYFTGEHPGQAHRFNLYAVATEAVPQMIADHSGALVGTLAAEATRIAAWRPRAANEVDDKAAPAELDWLRTAVHLNKGCYCGQESVARIVNLGKPPRRLTFLQLDGSVGSLPARGDLVTWNGRQVGVITSAARHAEMGPVALALLKRGLDPAAPLAVGQVAAAQELIVPVEGRSDHSPAERPGAGLTRLGGSQDPRDLRAGGMAR